MKQVSLNEAKLFKGIRQVQKWVHEGKLNEAFNACTDLSVQYGDGIFYDQSVKDEYTDLLAHIIPRDNGNPAGIAAIERSIKKNEIMNEMHAVDTIDTVLMFHNMNYINLICLDSGMSMHIATYNRVDKTWTDFNTQKPISEPVLFCHLPSHNEYLFNGVSEKLYPNTPKI